jgi:exopolysaccharide biosynthesis polyprenyl glycosylphosphotransferase
MAGDTPTAAFRHLKLDATPTRTTHVRAVMNAALPILDLLALAAAFALAYVARISLTVPFIATPDSQPRFLFYLPTLALQVVVIMAIFYFNRLYHLRRAISRIDHARKVIGAITVGLLIVYGMQPVMIALFFSDTVFEVDYPRGLLFFAWIFSMALTLLGRQFHLSTRNFLRQRGVACDNLLIVGNGKVAREIARKIGANPKLGYNAVGVVVNGKTQTRTNLSGIPVIGVYQDLPTLIDGLHVDQVIIAVPEMQRDELAQLVSLCQRGHVDIKIYPDIFSYMAGDISVDELGGTPLLTVRDIAMRGWKLSLKRAVDFLGSLFGMVFLSPFMLLTTLLIRLESKGPVFYSQERMGLDGKPFQVVKFRTMREDAEADGPGWTVKDDPRVTRLGRWMRKTNWDEIPQLMNVLVGEMSLVGPRPERPVYVLEFREQIPRYMERHREKAGMTGWAQVNGLRGDTSIEERTEYDLWYVENWSLWLDFKIIIRTIWQTISRRDRNAY